MNTEMKHGLMKFGAALGLAGALLGACTVAPKTPDDCAKTDWARAGSRAIERGQPLASAWQRASAECVALGAPVNRAAFEQSWGAGFAAYCAPRNALRLGRSGLGHEGICTPPFEAEFIRAHDFGRVLKRADEERSDANSAMLRARAVANDDKKPQNERFAARRDEERQQALRDNAAGRVSALEATSAQLGWGLGR